MADLILSDVSKEFRFVVKWQGIAINATIKSRQGELIPEIYYSGEDVRKAIVSMGDNPYVYFFKLPMTLATLPFYSLADIRALFYFARDYLYEKFLENAAPKDELDQSSLCLLMSFVDFCKNVEHSIEFFICHKNASCKIDDSRPRPMARLELDCSDNLAKKLHGRREVVTPSGRIDVLTDSQVIEVKDCNQWASAVGQVLKYCIHYPLLTPRIHLFGEKSKEMMNKAIPICEPLGIVVSCDES